MTDSSAFRKPKFKHSEGWVDDKWKNQENIYQCVRFWREIQEIDDVELLSDFNKVLKVNLDYQRLAKYDPYSKEKGSGYPAIHKELAEQLIEQDKDDDDYSLPYLIVETLSDLLDYGIQTSVSAAELILLYFVDFSIYKITEGATYYDDIKRIQSNLSPDVPESLLYHKVYRLRQSLGVLEEGDSPLEPDYSYIKKCEKLAFSILGERRFNDAVRTIQKATWALDATDYFAYSHKGYTLKLREEKYQEFKRDVMKPIARQRIEMGQHHIRREFVDIELTWDEIKSICGRVDENDFPAKDPLDDVYTHRLANNPLSVSVLLEVAFGELFQQIDDSPAGGHNCAYTDKGDTFLRNSPPGAPDAYALYDDDLFVTIEVSAEDSKCYRKPIEKHGIDLGYSNSNNTVTTFHNDIFAAIAHNVSAAEKNNKDATNCPRFVFIYSKDAPIDDEAMKTVLSSAGEQEYPTVIPMTFSQKVGFMDSLMQITGYKDAGDITRKEWKGILLGIQERLKDIYEEWEQYIADIEDEGSDKKPSEDLQKIKLGDFAYLFNNIIWKEEEVQKDLAKVRGERTGGGGGHGDGR